LDVSSHRIGLRRTRALIGALALICSLTPAAAADTGSSPEDRARFVSITQKLEQSPLSSVLQADRAWAMRWLTEAPDVSVTVCADPLAGVIMSDYRYNPEILAQYTFAMAALVIEHPEAASDPNAQQLAGVESALNAYRAILRDEPQAKAPELDGLLQRQGHGGLADFVRKAFARCSKKK